LKKILSLLLILICLHGYAQSVKKNTFTTFKTAAPNVLKIYKEAVKEELSGKVDKAVLLFQKVIKDDSTMIDAWLHLGKLYLDGKQYDRSNTFLEKAISIDTVYDASVFYYNGFAYLSNNKFEKAKLNFNNYLKASKKQTNLEFKTKKTLFDIEVIEQSAKNPIKFNPIKLSAAINTSMIECFPVLNPEGNRLTFTRRDGGKDENFYQASLVDNEWKNVIPLTEINTENNEGAQTLDGIGKTLIFTYCDVNGKTSCDLYIQKKGNNNWSKPIMMDINSEFWDSQGSLSADGTTLFFISKRLKGKGGTDIWVSHKLPEKKWSTPYSLDINTTNDEYGPFIHADNKTLYFASNGYPSMGGQDLYKVELKWENNKLVGAGKPQNLGYPLNTKYDETGIVVSVDGKTGFFATDRLANSGENKMSNPDIYQFELDESIRPTKAIFVKGMVTDNLSKQKIAASIDIIDLGTSTKFKTIWSDGEGEFLITLPYGKDWGIAVSKEKYLYFSEHIDLSDGSSFVKPIIKNIDLTPISGALNTKIVMRNIFFETGSASLMESSQSELMRLKNILDENPSMKIRIDGHTDNVGNDQSNMTLSLNRAKAVYEFLTKNYISSNRLSFKGFGKTIPIDTNDTPEGRQNNRRIEFTIIN
jgi:outer membrane protein OmpA-like peptidoglycan-associated protein/tetratricopeptide (TPR) repeat protein